MSLATRSYRLSPLDLFSARPAGWSPGPLPAAAPPPDPQAPAEALAAMCALADRLRAAPLSAVERSALGGAVSRAAPALSHQLASAILAEPARHGALCAAARRLRAQQAEAEGWLALREALGALFSLAGDAYLRAQGACAGQVDEILGQIPPAARGGLRPAEIVIAAQRAACVPPRRAAAPPQLSPRAIAARAAARAARRAAVYRCFLDSLLDAARR